MNVVIVKIAFVFYFTTWIRFEMVIRARKMFRNIVGNDVKISQKPTETLILQNPSFIACAMECDFSPGCKAFNMRATNNSLKICELFHYYVTDIFNQSNRENGSTYFEKVMFIDYNVKKEPHHIMLLDRFGLFDFPRKFNV